MQVGPSRPLPYSVRKPSDFVPSDPLHSRSRMRTPQSGWSCGELVRTRLYSLRLSCEVPRPTPTLYTYPDNRPPRPDLRAPPRGGNSPQSLRSEEHTSELQ